MKAQETGRGSPPRHILKKSQDELDAEYILETVMHRRNFLPTVRDELAACLARVRENDPLRTATKGKKGLKQ